ncbi:CDP-alcohol phosphatidyltransferase family protein [Cryptosporangium aurantiacum]|uniref:CDP-diacylglycerol-phosphatidylglycerol phosphatidyltransferase n=1 Tax=Cryptosporangium aurantiacum TaxID=134849 RepID=A0A1M7RMP4_9ACTN|nr:CDP-alcohol phosphatidyltransferase family protein [Cryptosporangium aurantiacum]SHN47461.1 CDP-diacylglycerol-phosphatidylglycerol phosphatidyltransferase [Cryptosporangium aurantiacum]
MPEASEVASAPVVADPPVTARVLTVPNALSALRLLGVPVFVYLVLVAHADLLALLVLVVSGLSDWLDGALARAWGQVSRIGQLLDPLADRLYVFSTVVTFAIRDIIPWWMAVALIVRDGVLWLALMVLRRYGYGPLPVHYIGKAATFNLLYAFPLLLLAGQDGIVGTIAAPVGWAFAIWGVGLYWWAAALYVVQTGSLVRLARRERLEAAG